MSKVFIVSALRTPIGTFDGNLRGFSEQQLCAELMKNMNDGNKYDEIIIGNAKQTSTPSNLARHAALLAGISQEVPAYTVQRQSASGLQAIANGYWLIKSGLANTVMAGGAESMSNIPIEIHNARFAFNENTKIVFDTITAHLEGAQPEEIYGKLTAEQISENIAKLYGLSEDDLRRYASSGVEKAQKRTTETYILPLEVRKKKATEVIDTDELYARPESIARPADGAALCLLTNEESGAVLGEVLSFGFSAGEPEHKGWIGEGAVISALKKANLSIHQIGLIECNEVFASQTLALKKELVKMGAQNLDNTFNTEGGGLVLGSTWGGAGAILTVDLLNRMNKKGIQHGMVVVPAEGGQVMAAIFKGR